MIRKFSSAKGMFSTKISLVKGIQSKPELCKTRENVKWPTLKARQKHQHRINLHKITNGLNAVPITGLLPADSSLRCVSIFDKTSYRTISWSLKATRLIFQIIAALWNLTGISVVVLPICLSNFRAIRKSSIQKVVVSRLHKILH